jgi:hypothetical protein
VRKVLGLSLLVGALLGAVVGFVAARLSHVSTFAVAGLTISEGPVRAIEFRPSTQRTLTWAVLGGIVAALLVVVVSVRAGVRLVNDSTRPPGRLLTAVCLVAGAVLGALTVVLAHYRSWIVSLHTHQFGLDTVVADRPSWLPSLPVAIGTGAIIGVVGAQVIQSAGGRLVSGKKV